MIIAACNIKRGLPINLPTAGVRMRWQRPASSPYAHDGQRSESYERPRSLDLKPNDQRSFFYYIKYSGECKKKIIRA